MVAYRAAPIDRMAYVSTYPRPSGGLTAPLPDACGKIAMNHGGDSRRQFAWNLRRARFRIALSQRKSNHVPVGHHPVHQSDERAETVARSRTAPGPCAAVGQAAYRPRRALGKQDIASRTNALRLLPELLNVSSAREAKQALVRPGHPGHPGKDDRAAALTAP